MALVRETLLKQDLELGYGTAFRTADNGGSLTGDKIGIHTFLGDAYLSAADFNGANVGERIAAAYAALPSTGGIIDARDDEGDQTISTNPFAGVTKPVELLLGVATYIVSSALTYTTSGDQPGLKIHGAGINKTILDNRVANGAMIYLDGGGGSTFAYGAVLSDFKIITTTSPATSHGIQLRGQWLPTIERVWITGLTGDGIRIKNDSTDADSTSYLIVSQCVLQSNVGWGFRVVTPPLTSGAATTAFNSFTLKNSHITLNTAGGVYLSGVELTITNTSIAYNTGPGLVMAYEVGVVTQQPYQVDVRDCEFDNNGTYSIDIQGVTHALIENTKFINGATGPATMVSIGRTSTTTLDLYIRGCIVRHDDGVATAFSISAASSYTRIEDTLFLVNAGTLTKYSDSGIATSIRQDGSFRRPLLPVAVAVVAASYTPDTYVATVYRLNCTTLGTVTMNAPIFTGGAVNAGGTVAGVASELVLLLRNGTAGEVSFAFNAVYVLTSRLINPLPGEYVTARFVYDSTGDVWIQVGGWGYSVSKQSSVTVSYTPDAGIAAMHRLSITATGAFVVNNPTKVGGTLKDGDTMDLIIVNNSGGAVTVTFGAAFSHTGYANPANTLQTTARFIYHGGAWFLIGSWSTAY